MIDSEFEFYQCTITLRLREAFPVADEKGDFTGNATGCIITLFIKNIEIANVFNIITKETIQVHSNDGCALQISQIENVQIELVKYDDLEVKPDSIDRSQDLLLKSGIIFFIHDVKSGFFNKIKNWF